MHARGLRLRGVERMLAISYPPVLPSTLMNGVGTPVAIISQLNTLPALPPVNASMATLRLATHDSGPGWLATPFLYDSFIHNSTPVLSRRTHQPARLRTLFIPHIVVLHSWAVNTAVQRHHRRVAMLHLRLSSVRGNAFHLG